MKKESTLWMQIEYLRERLNRAAEENLNSAECYRLSLEMDRLLELYLDEIDAQ